MLYLMFLAHLLADYLFQSDGIARWKARSLSGVLAHGAIVILTTLMCAALVSPAWWPYAVLIGLTHAVIDLVRARFLRTSNQAWELIWYLLDQLAHLAVIVLVVAWTRAPSRSELAGVAVLLADPRALACAIGYTLLLNPAWVFLRLTVRGVWGSDAAPHLGGGAKYGPMVERVLIASCVLTGQLRLVPLVLLPRRLVPLVLLPRRLVPLVLLPRRLVPLRVQRFSSLSPSFGAWAAMHCTAWPQSPGTAGFGRVR